MEKEIQSIKTIKHILKVHRISQTELSEESGIPRGVLSYILNPIYYEKISSATNRLVEMRKFQISESLNA